MVVNTSNWSETLCTENGIKTEIFKSGILSNKCPWRLEFLAINFYFVKDSDLVDPLRTDIPHMYVNIDRDPPFTQGQPSNK